MMTIFSEDYSEHFHAVNPDGVIAALCLFSSSAHEQRNHQPICSRAVRRLGAAGQYWCNIYGGSTDKRQHILQTQDQKKGHFRLARSNILSAAFLILLCLKINHITYLSFYIIDRTRTSTLKLLLFQLNNHSMRK